MKRVMKKWTKAEDKILSDNYIKLSFLEISKLTGHSIISCKNKANHIIPVKLKHKKLRMSQYKKGLIPWNKNLKGLQFSPATQFKKGHKPINMKYDGCISIRKKWTGEAYKFIRLSNDNWMPYHRYLWQKKNGNIPAGCIIVFKNGDAMDCRIENLKCITMAENLKRNSPEGFRDWDRHKSKRYIAALLTRGKPDERKELILNHPEIIQMKVQQLKLQRAIYAAKK